jgi:tetratricopeptide (TPR) repeat protein
MSQVRRAAAPLRSIGRQLTRAGALFQRLRLLAPAEAGFRVAVWLSAEVAWCVRLGRIQEARKRWAAAEATYARCLALVDRSPQDEHRRAGIHYRQARVRTHRKDWDGAEAAFGAALALRPDAAAWHAHLGEVHAGREGWAAAAECYRQATVLQPEALDWRVGAARAYTKAGRPDQAVEAGAAGLDRIPDHPRLAQTLTAAYQSVGDWRATAGLLRAQLNFRPEDYALRLRLVDCLEVGYLVPFTLDHHGLVAVAAEERKRYADDALAEAIDHLEHLTAREPDRPGAAFRLGLLYERSGQLVKAAAAYRVAMARLAEVDSWWCHRAAHEWWFRYSYVQQRLAPSESAGQRVRRTATPAASPARPPGEPAPAPAGFFDAVMFRHGLQLSGFLLPGPHQVVEIHLDDLLIKQVRVEATEWRPALRFDLTHGLLNDFPEQARLTVRADRQALVTVGGAEALEIRVPGGKGRVGRKLATGLLINKKGAWPRTGSRLAKRQGSYLRVYQRARELLDQQGRQLFLSYGTLLGCHREGRFIPSDDDFDAAYSSRAASPEQFRRECWRAALALLRSGLDVKLAINGRLFQVGLDGVWIDIAPMWFYRGRAWAFDAHDLGPDSFEPVRTGTFLGKEVYLPRDPEAFLADAYGSDWRTPQPQFRHYRAKADDRILSQMWAKPSEVRRFAKLAEAERAGNPAAGKFLGVGAPGYPGFSWLTSPDGPGPPDISPDPLTGSGPGAADR